MNIPAIREKIPALTRCTHLNCAAVSPLFSDSIREMQQFLENRGKKADFDFFSWLEQLDVCREKVSTLVNGFPEEIAFMLNTSQGINTVAGMIPWKKGDTIVTTDLEFPSNSVPWYNLKKKGVLVKQVHNVNGEILLEDMDKAIDDSTRLVAISYVQFGNGFRSNLQAISGMCKEHDALLFSDAIQGLGAVELDVKKMGIDFFSSASYKWLMGPLGVAIFYIKQELLDEFDPPGMGWFSLKNHEDFDRPGVNTVELADTARKFETGGKSFALVKGLEKSLDILLKIGVRPIEKRVLHLSQYVIDNVDMVNTPYEKEKRAGIVSIAHDNAEKVVEQLKSKNILVSARVNGIRVSTHFWNTKEDIDQLLENL
ncbi:MAG: aminotransferase class V-fold PLP-dependent enzyme [Candidatus Methanofastidiosia archaeon]|jgi:selenocysteine lyase/cysteine desulfurase